MTKSKKITIAVSVIACLLVVLILGTVFDLQISKAIADLPDGQYFTGNIFAIIGECIGEDVLYLLVITSCAILFYYLLKNPLQKKWLNYVLQAIVVFISYIVSVYLFYVTLDNLVPYTIGVGDYISSTVGKITIFIFPIFIASLIYLLVSKIKPEIIKSLWKWALLVLIVAIISNSIIQATKHIFDRTRFRAMVFSGDEEFTYFTNWFTINRNKLTTNSLYADDFFKSFPSGHTCAASSTFVLVLLPYYLENINTKRNKIIIWFVASVYTFLVAFSRIVAGAHFFTDVYIAFLITAITIILTFIVINLICKKLNGKIATSSVNTNKDDKTINNNSSNNNVTNENKEVITKTTKLNENNNNKKKNTTINTKENKK